MEHTQTNAPTSGGKVEHVFEDSTAYQQTPSEVTSSTNNQRPDLLKKEQQTLSEVTSSTENQRPDLLKQEQQTLSEVTSSTENQRPDLLKQAQKTLSEVTSSNLLDKTLPILEQQSLLEPTSLKEDGTLKNALEDNTYEIEMLWGAVYKHVRLWWDDNAEEDDKSIRGLLSQLKEKRDARAEDLFPQKLLRRSIKAIASNLKELALKEPAEVELAGTAQKADEAFIKPNKNYDALLDECRTDLVAFLRTVEWMEIAPQFVMPINIMENAWSLFLHDLPLEDATRVWTHLQQPVMHQSMVWNESSYCINELAGILLRKFHPARYLEGIMQKLQDFHQQISLKNDELGIRSDFMGLPLAWLQEIIAAHREENRDLVNSRVRSLRDHCLRFEVSAGWADALKNPPESVSPLVAKEEWDETQKSATAL